MFLRNDVLDVERRQRRVVLMKLTVFASITGSVPNQGARGLDHELLVAAGGESARPPLQDAHELDGSDVPLVFSQLVVAELAFIRLICEFLDSAL